MLKLKEMKSGQTKSKIDENRRLIGDGEWRENYEKIP